MNKIENAYKSEAGKKIIQNLYNNIIKASPVKLEKHMINTNYGQTAIFSTGSATNPIMILLHGSGSNSASWFADLTAFSKKYRVILIDIPGEAGSSSVYRFPLKEASKWLNECLEKLNINSAIFGGISLGGWICLDFAIKYPSKVNRLFLMAPAGLVPPINKIIIKIIFFSLLGKWGNKKLMQLIFQSKNIPEEVESFYYHLNRNFKYRRETPPCFTKEELNTIGAELLFIGGKADKLFNTIDAEKRIQECIKKAEVIINNEGHAFFNKNKAILRFLNKDAQ